MTPPTEKHCGGCKLDRPIEVFFKNTARADGYSSYCKPCHYADSRKRSAKYAEERKANRGCNRCGGPRDRGNKTRICSGCMDEGPTCRKPIRAICQWCGEPYQGGRLRKFCTSMCRETSNNAAKQAAAGTVVVNEKACSKCELVKPALDFNYNADSTTGLASQCRACTAGKHREWRSQNGDKIRNTNLVRTYGITLEEYQTLVEHQGGGCAFCGRRPRGTDRRLSVDHDHNTGAIRAACCDACNKFKISNLTKEDVEKLWHYFNNPPADEAFGERRFVPKGMEQGPRRKKRQPRKRKRGENNG